MPAKPTGQRRPQRPIADANPEGRDAEQTGARRKQILKAAVKVFAERGYHACRIADVAEEASVAYGLVYHYYRNKDGLLAAVFDTNWAFFQKAVDEIADSTGSTYDKVKQIVELAFQAYEMAPLVVKVLVLEFGRNARLGEALHNPQVARVFRSIARIFQEGQTKGDLDPVVDPVAMSVIFMGSLETAFVSFVLAGDGKTNTLQSAFSVEAMRATLLAIVSRTLVNESRVDPASTQKR
jgi:TetR/AcrR family fatty acid metabolism transcriptional regulator